MKCPVESQEHAEKLLAYCAHKLDYLSAAALEEHIQTCSACTEFVRGQKAVWQAMDTWEAAPVSADFDRRLYQRIQQEVSWWDLLVRPFRPLLVRQGLPLAAAACLLVGAGYLLQRPIEVPSTTPPQAEASADQVDHAIDDMEILHQLNHLVRTDANPRM
jgi:hypothetical protein